MATNLSINLSEDNMLAQVTGPDDLKNYFHIDPLGDLLLLDSKMLPIPLSAPRPVTAYQKISPHTFWNNRQTRQCNANTTSPPLNICIALPSLTTMPHPLFMSLALFHWRTSGLLERTWHMIQIYLKMFY